MFATSYAHARECFQAAAAQVDARQWRSFEPGQGRAGEALTVDFAEIVPDAAQGILLLTSGCHGVEGYAGSAVQCALLGDPDFVRALHAARLRAVLVHALNPHGFSHGRRATAEGVDLNRNAVDFLRPRPRNDDYAALHPLLVPAAWPPPDASERALLDTVRRMGLRAFQAVVTAGQYDHPQGLFYGGHRATWALRVFEGLLAGLVRDRLPIVWIDLHTGLGPFGQAERIFTGGAGPAADALALACALWGEVTQPDDGSAVSAALNGSLPSLARERLGSLLKASLTWEMGTVPPLTVLQALRADASAHQTVTPDPALRDAACALMRDAFCPDSGAWRHAVLTQGRAVVEAVVRSSAWL